MQRAPNAYLHLDINLWLNAKPKVSAGVSRQTWGDDIGPPKSPLRHSHYFPHTIEKMETYTTILPILSCVNLAADSKFQHLSRSRIFEIIFMFRISGLDMDIAVNAIWRENYFPKARRNWRNRKGGGTKVINDQTRISQLSLEFGTIYIDQHWMSRQDKVRAKIYSECSIYSFLHLSLPTSNVT